MKIGLALSPCAARKPAAPSAPAAYWRVLVNSLVPPAEATLELAEVQFFDVQGGTDITTGGTGTASAETVGFEATKAFDKVVANSWRAAFGAPQWIRYQFAAPVAPRYLTITGSAVDENRDPSSLTIQRSTDGTNWSDVATFSGLTWPAPNYVHGFTIP